MSGGVSARFVPMQEMTLAPSLVAHFLHCPVPSCKEPRLRTCTGLAASRGQMTPEKAHGFDGASQEDWLLPRKLIKNKVTLQPCPHEKR